jgi:hypothetical protein
MQASFQNAEPKSGTPRATLALCEVICETASGGHCHLLPDAEGSKFHMHWYADTFKSNTLQNDVTVDPICSFTRAVSE